MGLSSYLILLIMVCYIWPGRPQLSSPKNLPSQAFHTSSTEDVFVPNQSNSIITHSESSKVESTPSLISSMQSTTSFMLVRTTISLTSLVQPTPSIDFIQPTSSVISSIQPPNNLQSSCSLNSLQPSWSIIPIHSTPSLISIQSTPSLNSIQTTPNLNSLPSTFSLIQPSRSLIKVTSTFDPIPIPSTPGLNSIHNNFASTISIISSSSKESVISATTSKLSKTDSSLITSASLTPKVMTSSDIFSTSSQIIKNLEITSSDNSSNQFLTPITDSEMTTFIAGGVDLDTNTINDTKCPSKECYEGEAGIMKDSTPAVTTFTRKVDCDLAKNVLSLEACKEYVNHTKSFQCFSTISSCHGKCGQILTSCSCDFYCALYNVCCYDFQDVCPNIWAEATHTLGRLVGVNIECVGDSNSYLVIAGCSSENSTTVDKTLCHRGEVGINSIDDLHFKNVACLKCNGFDETKSKLWNLAFQVSFDRDYTLSILAGIDSENIRKSFLRWKVPSNLVHTVRICSRGLIEDCPPGADALIKEKCVSSTANVLAIMHTEANKIYKNEHCANCHIQSDYYCRGTREDDYIEDLKAGRFSSIISLIFEGQNRKFELEASRPFTWKNAECSGKINDLDCNITKCLNNIALVNNTCVPQRMDTCVWIEISLANETKAESNCTSNSTCKASMVDELITSVKNTHLRKHDLQIEKVIFQRDAINLRIEIMLIFTLWSQPFPYNLEEIYDAYRLFVKDFFYAHAFNGEFFLCINFVPAVKNCPYLVCESRKYDIHSPAQPKEVNSRARRLTITQLYPWKLFWTGWMSFVTFVTCLYLYWLQ